MIYFHRLDLVVALMVIIPLSILYTGITPFHLVYLIAASVGYFYYLLGIIKYKNFRWYANV